MTRDELVYIALGVVFAGVLMAILHERHYSTRRERIEHARAVGATGTMELALQGALRGLDVRLTELETIIMEDRET